MPIPASSRPGLVELVERPRNPAAVLVGVAAVVLLGLVVRSGGGDPAPPPGTGEPDGTDATVERADVVALRPAPWLEDEADVVAVIAGFGGLAWVVDVAAGTVSERRFAQDEPAFSPVSGVVAGHILSEWDGRIMAVPLDGGAPVDLAVADRRVPRPSTFPSERPGAVWTVEPADAAPDTNEVVVTERTVDGQILRRAAGTFPLFSGPVAASGGGLLAYGQGRDVSKLGIVDIDTGARRHLTEIERSGALIAADHATVVTSGSPCTPGCTLTVVDTTTGARRVVPAPAQAGVRASAGSISPDGATLVHSVSTTVADDPRPRYVVTDLVTGASRLTDVSVGPGVAWAADGGAFLAAPRRRGGRGSDSRLVVHHVDTAETEELPVLVRIPAREPWALGG